jgi:CRP-like cAMP-binding protein
LQFYPFSEEQINIFCQKIVVRNLSKHALLLQHGHVCDFTAIVVHGSLRLYTKSRQNKSEQTLHFFTETDWITEYDCFVSQKPTANFIKALENTEIAVISFSDIHSLIRKDDCFLLLGRLMQQWSISAAHAGNILYQSPDERYKKLQVLHPDWIIRFPQKYIASYLGMTGETLNKVKKRIS